MIRQELVSPTSVCDRNEAFLKFEKSAHSRESASNLKSQREVTTDRGLHVLKLEHDI